jgi:hypothetical protein
MQGKLTVTTEVRMSNDKRPLLPAHLLRQIAVEASVDPRTLSKVLRGEPVRSMPRDRIIRVLRERNLLGYGTLR